MLVKAIFLKAGSAASPAEITDIKIKFMKIYSGLKKGNLSENLPTCIQRIPVSTRTACLVSSERRTHAPTR